MITVYYRTGDANLSVLVANAFAAELLRSARLQVLAQQRYNAQAQLSTELAKFGEKHPKVVELRKRVAAADDSLKEQRRESTEAILQAAGENVTAATPAAPSPKRTFVMSLALLLGLIIGMGVALWLEWRRWWLAF
jgi:uncharacterized protein involved in exopolysaccharide biosynthesis